MRVFKPVVATALATLLSGMAVALCTGTAVAHASLMDKSSETPDLMQSDPEAGLPDGGEQFCGPVAAMNSMVWLARHGYPNLAPMQLHSVHPERLDVQGKMALELSIDMHTTLRGGTGAKSFLTGIEKYIQKKGYTTQSLKYFGWEEHPKRFHVVSKGATLPALSLIKDAVAKENTAVWLKIGWYRYFPDTGKFVRFAGHWVTVVGIENTVNASRSSTFTLIIHDPSPRSGKNITHERVTVNPIAHGHVSTGYDKELRDARGFYNLKGDLKIKRKADCGLLDGVAILTLNQPL